MSPLAADHTSYTAVSCLLLSSNRIYFFISPPSSLLCSPINCLLYCTQSLESDILGNWIKVSIKSGLLRALTSEVDGEQKETQGGHISSREINSSWSCWLHHFITFVYDFSTCLQLLQSTNYSVSAPRTPAVNPRLRSWWKGKNKFEGDFVF